ncbi:MAG: amino acid ABC transporter substrate-binding protein [Clostridia bacterium]|nr:amino acid ABC transporter substrate-binding protein [Clostridia bacterium]
MNKKLLIIPIISALCASLISCGRADDNKSIKIAVMGNADNFNSDYKLGIEQAIEDLNSEYADTAFSFEYELYDDKNSYETGAVIIDRLSSDDSVTAVVAPNITELNRLAAYVFDENNKLFLIPYILNDSAYSGNFYNTVFSLTYSNTKIGRIMRGAAAKTPAKRWAACIDNSELSMSELHGFINSNSDDNIKLADCVSFESIEGSIEEKFRMWDTLGVEGIMLLSADERFDDFKIIKKRFPDAQFILNSSFDKSEIILKDAELMSLLNNVIQTAEFTGYPHDDKAEKEFKTAKEMFEKKHGKAFDLWYLHAYNMIRMIGDTAVRIDSTDPECIAKALHSDGYDGICESYEFNESGERTDYRTEYAIYADNGRCYMMSLDE